MKKFQNLKEYIQILNMNKRQKHCWIIFFFDTIRWNSTNSDIPDIYVCVYNIIYCTHLTYLNSFVQINYLFIIVHTSTNLKQIDTYFYVQKSKVLTSIY